MKFQKTLLFKTIINLATFALVMLLFAYLRNSGKFIFSNLILPYGVVSVGVIIFTVGKHLKAERWEKRILLNEPGVGAIGRDIKGRYEYIHILDDSIAFSLTEKCDCKELMDCYSWTINNLFKSITVFLVFLPLFAAFSTMMFYEKDTYHMIYGVLILLAFLFIVVKMLFFASGKTLIPKNDIANIEIKHTLFGTALLIKYKEFRCTKKRGFILPRETGQTAGIIRLLEHDGLICK
ncbi:MAG: hypothetical protein ABFD10_07965 [Prolixibacteraceae bacterium]